MKVVADTNVLLAGFGTHGLCEALLTVCLEQHVLVLSEHLLAEFRQHLGAKFKVAPEQTETALAFLRTHAEIVEPADTPAGACRDADDLPVLGTLTAGKADLLVTGDRDLLDLGTWQGVPILGPRAAYARLLA